MHGEGTVASKVSVQAVASNHEPVDLWGDLTNILRAAKERLIEGFT